MLPPRKTPAQEALDALAATQPDDGSAHLPRDPRYGPFIGSSRGGHIGAQTGPLYGAKWGGIAGTAIPPSNRVIAAAPLAGAYNGELGGRRYRGRS